ncbi:hypothetical protein GN277_12695 [Lachnospiraceae bacterium WCA-9-b2]|uniref:Bacterial sugar transferase domain-containing protein n=2 Tax=Sporofaciens musculi TaxID=2681861 RepID=A0A7X3MGZ3_9FIRM|nr:hypothetical protein [Sporofaciens musculi]
MKSRRIKRLFDCIFGIILGIIAIPILIITSIFVFICSPEASPIFRQVRVGYKGKEFAMLKLRTMDLCQYFRQKKLKDYAAFLSSSSSFCCGVR